jgi:hypothetical protein
VVDEAALAVVDPGDDLDDEERAHLDTALLVSEAEIRRGEGVPAAQVLAELRASRRR